MESKLLEHIEGIESKNLTKGYQNFQFWIFFLESCDLFVKPNFSIFGFIVGFERREPTLLQPSKRVNDVCA